MVRGLNFTVSILLTCCKENLIDVPGSRIELDEFIVAWLVGMSSDQRVTPQDNTVQLFDYLFATISLLTLKWLCVLVMWLRILNSIISTIVNSFPVFEIF